MFIMILRWKESMSAFHKLFQYLKIFLFYSFKKNQISALAVEMGSESGCSAMLRWTGGGGENILQPVGPAKPVIRPTPSGQPVDWAAFIVNPVVRSVQIQILTLVLKSF